MTDDVTVLAQRIAELEGCTKTSHDNDLVYGERLNAINDKFSETKDHLDKQDVEVGGRLDKQDTALEDIQNKIDTFRWYILTTIIGFLITIIIVKVI
jgi:hypothetical protein